MTRECYDLSYGWNYSKSNPIRFLILYLLQIGKEPSIGLARWGHIDLNLGSSIIEQISISKLLIELALKYAAAVAW